MQAKEVLQSKIEEISQPIYAKKQVKMSLGNAEDTKCLFVCLYICSSLINIKFVSEINFGQVGLDYW